VADASSTSRPSSGSPPALHGLYVASKHAIEGYSESLDHEVREHGVRVLLVQPAFTRTSFDTDAAQPDTRCRCPRSDGASSTR
jgi:short-subunit dehydrogenase